MPFFNVTVSGEGINVPVDDGQFAIGFFATRCVLARDEMEAIHKAMEAVREDFYKNVSGEGDEKGLVLKAENCCRISILRALFKKSSGYTFYQSL